MRRGLALMALVGLLLGGCTSAESPGDDRLRIVAAFYPLAELASRVGGDLVTVRNLTPVGVEPHDVELTPDDVDAIEDADVVLLVGNGFQESIAKAAARRDDNTVDVARGIARNDDPHFWLDPTLMVRGLEAVLDALSAADPDHADVFKANAEQFGRELTGLDERYQTALANCARRDLVTAHAAFSYLAARYGLTQHAISGVSPEAEASPARLVELERLVRERGVTTIFYEELVPRAFAETLAREAGVRTEVLSPLEGLTKTEQQRGDDYLSVMGRNRVALVDALGCT